MDRETRLGVLATAILEGRAVDWGAVESTTDSVDREVVAQLQVLADIAALHRDSDPGRSGDARPELSAKVAWGHLRLVELIGHGTYGDVYRAWDPHLDREVALKLLRSKPSLDDSVSSIGDPARAVNEGRLLARVRHPHVITVYGAEPRDGSVGIWMELIRGRTLHRIVQEQGPFGAREAAGIGIDLCRALAAVHAARLIHRDVSARNVMREDGGRVVLMDFGVGHEIEKTAEERSRRDVTGTPVYMAPELFTGSTADVRTDVYALGILLYHLVSGRFPIAGATVEDIRQAHAHNERRRLRDVRADLPSSFVHVVEKATASRPDSRYLTAGEFEEALDRAVRGIADAQRPWLSKRMIAAAAMAAVVITAAASRSWLQLSRSREGNPSQATAGLVSRKLSLPDAVWPFSNPSDDGRLVAGLVTASGDVGIVDMTTGAYRALGMGRGDFSDGYASLGMLSPDGTVVAVDWHDDRGGSLRTIRTDGTERHILVADADDVWVWQWSRDNSLILAVIQRGGVKEIAFVAASDGAVRSLRRLDGAIPQHMGLSPDGRYIVYDSREASDALDRDIFVLDAHTGNQWPLIAEPGDDRAPFWSPDGQNVVFLSDRNRTESLWRVPVRGGQPFAPPELLKDGVGRVWLRGLTRAGALHYQLSAGFAEVFVADVDGAEAQPLSPRQVVSNFYPVWSPDGRYVAYGSERDMNDGRQLWVFDTETGTESSPAKGTRFGRPVGWSADGKAILAAGTNDGTLYVVDRVAQRTKLIAEEVDRAGWGPSGIAYRSKKRVMLYDPVLERTTRTLDYADPAFVSFNLAADGRSVLALRADGTLELQALAWNETHTWHAQGEPGWVDAHYLAPHAKAVAFIVGRKDEQGAAQTLMVWDSSEASHGLLRVRQPERMALAGWLPDDRTVLIVRWTQRTNGSASGPRNDTLWRVPIDGGTAVPTRLSMDGLRDVSIHPDGRRIAFNGRFKNGEQWVMENLLPR